MKIFATLLITVFASAAFAQLPADAWLYQSWINQGYAFEGSFYPANSWNAEKLTLKEDYTFERTVSRIEDYQLSSVTFHGKWGYNAATRKLRLYADNERYAPEGKIMLFQEEYAIDFSSPDYFTVTAYKAGHPVAVRFQREGAAKSFEQSVAEEKARLADLALKYDPEASYYFIVNSLKPSKKKITYFDEYYFYIHYSEYNSNAETETVETSYQASIADFTDSTLLLNIESEDIRIMYKNGMESSISNQYDMMSAPKVQKEIKLSNIDYVDYHPGPDLSALAPVTFSVSAITALLVAPLISINYKTGDFNKNRYYTTAGIGLIGIGASIPLAVLFNREKPSHFIRPGEEPGKRKFYLEKVRR